MRYKTENDIKKDGQTFTPHNLANFVAERLLKNSEIKPDAPLKILEPAVGDGELLLALLQNLKSYPNHIEIYSFDTNETSLSKAKRRLEREFPDITSKFYHDDFLQLYKSEDATGTGNAHPEQSTKFDLIIANPPYVRTQILGSRQASEIAEKFSLKGRVDLYQPFLIAMLSRLNDGGSMGAIVSNRFLTTKSGASIGEYIKGNAFVDEVLDLGDTKLFEASVLPSLLFCSNKNTTNERPAFTSIYECQNNNANYETTIFEALKSQEIQTFKSTDGKFFTINRGTLNFANTAPKEPWAISNDETDSWLEIVKTNTAKTFGEVSQVRVGIKSCADKVFLNKKWDDLEENKPELLFPLLTRKNLTRYSIDEAFQTSPQRQVLYPYDISSATRKPIELSAFPKTKAYLEAHRQTLSARTYVIEAGRQWYEIWVPHSPKNWLKTKIVFPDISEKPIFTLDNSGAIVSGECYWLLLNESEDTDLTSLILGVANSKFIEKFYDISFPNKLYSGKRRFITQYVEKFPLPDAYSRHSKEIIAKVKTILSVSDKLEFEAIEEEINVLVEKAFGLLN